MLAGAESEARRSFVALREQYPDLTVSEVQQGMPPVTQVFLDRVVDGLHTIGLPA